MISVLCENGRTHIDMNGKGSELLEEAGNLILELINGTGETVEERHEFGVMLLSGVVGTFMQEQIDGKYDEEKATEFVGMTFKFIVGNIKMNKNKDKLIDLIKEALLGDEQESAEPAQAEPAPEETAEAEGK